MSLYTQVEKEYFEQLKAECRSLQTQNEYLIEWIEYLHNRNLVERVFDIDRFLPLSIHPKYKTNDNRRSRHHQNKVRGTYP